MAEQVGHIGTLGFCPTSPDPKEAKLHGACQDFEAILLGYMLRSMRKAVPTQGIIEKNLGERIFTDLLDNEYAKVASRTGSLGLSDILYRQLNQASDQSSSIENAIGSYQENVLRSRIPIQNFQTQGLYQPQVSLDHEMAKQIAKYNSTINVAARQYRLDPNLIRGVIAQESRGNAYAVSSAGAMGLMQLMESTAEELGVQDSFDPTENIMAGSQYLRQMLNRFGNSTEKALASYNAGPSAVEEYNGIPPFPETQRYVQAVLNYYGLFRGLYGG